MRFINNLFGTSDSKENRPKIRGQFKDEKYFKKEIAYIDKVITIFKEDDKKYVSEHGALNPSQYLSYNGKLNKKVDNLYSLCEDINKIRLVFMESIEYFSKGWSEEFQGTALLVDMASKNALFDLPKEEFLKVKNFMSNADRSEIKEMWKPDSLVFFLIGEKDKKRKSAVPAYQKLYEITQMSKEEAEKSIKKYLEGWYQMNKNAPWYNNHLRDSGYSGYWAWEVAAVVKIMGLDDSSFKNNPYYPYDMVHWVSPLSPP